MHQVCFVSKFLLRTALFIYSFPFLCVCVRLKQDTGIKSKHSKKELKSEEEKKIIRNLFMNLTYAKLLQMYFWLRRRQEVPRKHTEKRLCVCYRMKMLDTLKRKTQKHRDCFRLQDAHTIFATYSHTTHFPWRNRETCNGRLNQPLFHHSHPFCRIWKTLTYFFSVSLSLSFSLFVLCRYYSCCCLFVYICEYFIISF